MFGSSSIYQGHKNTRSLKVCNDKIMELHPNAGRIEIKTFKRVKRYQKTVDYYLVCTCQDWGIAMAEVALQGTGEKSMLQWLCRRSQFIWLPLQSKRHSYKITKPPSALRYSCNFFELKEFQVYVSLWHWQLQHQKLEKTSIAPFWISDH